MGFYNIGVNDTIDDTSVFFLALILHLIITNAINYCIKSFIVDGPIVVPRVTKEMHQNYYPLHTLLVLCLPLVKWVLQCVMH